MEYKDGNTFLEFRLDYLSEPAGALPVIQSLSKRYADLRILATCRGKQQGGHFVGKPSVQVRYLHAAAEAGATAVDLEIESAEQVPESVAELRARVPVMLSFHDFNRTPPLKNTVKRLQRISADAYKLIVTATKPSDLDRVFTWLRQNQSQTPIVTFAMSELGTPTRILATSFGSAYTYAAPREGGGTAPGQVSSRLLRNLYRCEKLSLQTRIYGIVADPVAHSKSPLMHNRAFQARRLDAVYIPFRISPRHLSEWMKLAESLPIYGFSVTIPHKRAILRYLDVIDPVAKRIGAANTVWRKAGKWRGTNTDVDGVLRPLEKKIRLAGSSVLVAGYGGAARAAAFAVQHAGASVTITGRDAAQAAALARACRGQALPLSKASLQDFDILIHATPVGMSPDVNGCLFPDHLPGQIIFDMVYSPRETTLLKHARAQHLETIDGTEMLLEQALRQYEIWSGDAAPREAMAKALNDSLGG